MKKNFIFLIALPVAMLVLHSCKKKDTLYETNFPNATGTEGTLKAATDINMGVAVPYNSIGNAAYTTLVKNEFDGITLENNMKNETIVQNDGTLNFSEADAILAAYPNMMVFGHTLGWHEQQNAAYISSAAGLVASNGPDVAINGGFELGSPGNLGNYSVYNSNGATINVGAGSNEVRTGTRSMKVVNPTAFGGDQWKVQVAGDLVNTTPGTKYEIKYYVKSLTGAGSIRLSTGTNSGPGAGPQYQADQTIGSSWAPVTWQIVANSTQTRWLFDMGRNADTYFIDDVTINAVSEANGDPITVGIKVDSILKLYVKGMVNHFKPRVRAWDVVNEVLDNSGQIRNKANSPAAGANSFVWSHYLGRNFALNAFKYAREADATATLFINDYGLESNSAKLDSLVSYTKWLKNNGAPVDGIGTQMHITSLTRHDGIDAMMQKLAATGLKIRISELDVQVNTQNLNPYVFTPLDAYGQEQMYKYVISSYRKYIPAAQQFGITLWGLTDNTSWLYNNGKDFPLLFKGDFTKKSTYAAAISALK